MRLSKIQEMVEKIPSPLTGAICNERTGWLPFGFDAQVRQLVSNSIKELLRNHYKKENVNADVSVRIKALRTCSHIRFASIQQKQTRLWKY